MLHKFVCFFVSKKVQCRSIFILIRQLNMHDFVFMLKCLAECYDVLLKKQIVRHTLSISPLSTEIQEIELVIKNIDFFISPYDTSLNEDTLRIKLVGLKEELASSLSHQESLLNDEWLSITCRYNTVFSKHYTKSNYHDVTIKLIEDAFLIATQRREFPPFNTIGDLTESFVAVKPVFIRRVSKQLKTLISNSPAENQSPIISIENTEDAALSPRSRATVVHSGFLGSLNKRRADDASVQGFEPRENDSSTVKCVRR